MPTKPRRVFRLSDQEVRVLQTVFSNIGGSPTGSSRKTVDLLASRLIRTFGYQARIQHHTGSIFFHDQLSETINGR